MKRFFVMILLVSTFFIGLGSLIDGAKASFKSDAKALDLIRLSRIAIGGDANINSVRSMIITANTTHQFDKDGTLAAETGSLELAMQLPNQFSKKVQIGIPGENPDGVEKRIEVRIVKDADGNVLTENISGADDKRVMKMKKGDGTWTDENGNVVKIDGDAKVIMKKDDGTIHELKGGDKDVFIMKKGDNDGATWKSKDGLKNGEHKEVRIENRGGHHGNELLRTTLALLMTAPEGTDVAYTFAGEGTVDGSTCNIVLAQSGGSSYKLFLDKSTYLPRMISYQSEMHHIVRFRKDGAGNVEKEKVMEFKTEMSEGKSVEHQVKFSDFRSVGGLLLPHRWAESSGGKQTQTVEVSSFEINPANIADKFKDENVFIRKSQ